MCDRQSSLTIDSALVLTDQRQTNTSKVKFLLFSGEVVFTSEPIDIDSDERPKFVEKNLKEINSSLEPPIDLSFSYKENSFLINVRT